MIISFLLCHAGKPIVGLNLLKKRYLTLFNKSSASISQSLDHPADSLVTGQYLTKGKKLRDRFSCKYKYNTISFPFSTENTLKFRTYQIDQTVPLTSRPTTSLTPFVTPIHTLIPKLKGKPKSLSIILGSALGALSILTVILIRYLTWMKKYAEADEGEEEDLDQVLGMPARFSYKELNAATMDFSTKLGSGGFGSVFKGTLLDGRHVAVKKLEGFGYLKDSFLAELKTIGNTHHVNLVRLVGFCAEKTHRLLVYEYMANGSLDRWIFYKKNGLVLKWQQRKKIILDIAKGIHYLHEDCRQKIIHMDIKPQNILLDEKFNAKVSDFGLAKVIDRDQSQVIATMKGTPGYLAPERLSSFITEKVDVYSFGVVILEVVCGRKVFDNSVNEEEKHLIGVLERKAKEDKLLDMVDKYSEDMQLHGLQAVHMMKIAAWCLQGDLAKRPHMSMVIKVLEGVTVLPVDLAYNFSNPTWLKLKELICQKGTHFSFTTTLLLPSVLSGPR